MHDPHTGIDYLARTKAAPLLLYLDFDGVLHHEAVYVSPKKGIHIRERGFALFEWAHFLVDALQPHPTVRIVLSTSWCRQPGFSRACKWLPATLQARVIGGTFHRRAHGATFEMRHAFASQARGVQVLDDVRRRRPVDWLALDDAVEGWPESALGNLVACDGVRGLSDPDTRAALALRLQLMERTLDAHGRA